MREILFRGKRVDNGEWVYGYVAIHTIIGDETELKTVIVQKPDKIYQYDSWTVIPETIGQYTGLKDKNGKKIFEGDIVFCGDGKVPTEIRWVQESSAFMAYNLKRKECHLLNKYFDRFIGEVIGNEHDNQGLVED